MVGTIAALFIAVWFFKTAEASNQKPLNWLIAGVVVYFMSALFWTYFITPPIKDAASHSKNGFLIFLVRYAYIIFALACASFFKFKMTKKSAEE